MEVLAERMVQAALQLLHSTAELKLKALLACAVAEPAMQQHIAEGTSTGVQQQLTNIEAAAQRSLQLCAGLALH